MKQKKPFKRLKCEECGGKIIHRKVPYERFGIKIGNFKADVCTKCDEICFEEKDFDVMTKIVKEKGLWGLEAKTKIGKVGDSLDVRISKKILIL